MNKKIGVLIILLGLSVVVVALLRSKGPGENEVASAPPAEPHASHSTPSAKAPRVPAYQSAQASKNLGPTLAPDQFIGKTREAYKVANKSPQRWRSCRVIASVTADLGIKVFIHALKTTMHRTARFVLTRLCLPTNYKHARR